MSRSLIRAVDGGRRTGSGLPWRWRRCRGWGSCPIRCGRRHRRRRPRPGAAARPIPGRQCRSAARPTPPARVPRQRSRPSSRSAPARAASPRRSRRAGRLPSGAVLPWRRGPGGLDEGLGLGAGPPDLPCSGPRPESCCGPRRCYQRKHVGVVPSPRHQVLKIRRHSRRQESERTGGTGGPDRLGETRCRVALNIGAPDDSYSPADHDGPSPGRD
jgi:hypothetical protein